MGRSATLALMTLVAAFVWSPAADAATAMATSNVNMRAGPGTQYSRITLIPAGAAVEVNGCDGTWCRVVYGGVSGHASARYLDHRGYYAGPRYQSGSNIAPPIRVTPRNTPTYDPDRFRPRERMEDYSDFRTTPQNRGYQGWRTPHLSMTSRQTGRDRW